MAGQRMAAACVRGATRGGGVRGCTRRRLRMAAACGGCAWRRRTGLSMAAAYGPAHDGSAHDGGARGLRAGSACGLCVRGASTRGLRTRAAHEGCGRWQQSGPRAKVRLRRTVTHDGCLRRQPAAARTAAACGGGVWRWRLAVASGGDAHALNRFALTPRAYSHSPPNPPNEPFSSELPRRRLCHTHQTDCLVRNQRAEPRSASRPHAPERTVWFGTGAWKWRGARHDDS